MANPTFNAGIDYFGVEVATSNALKVVSSNENRSKQSANGPNTYGDACAVDSWGETAAPQSVYELVAALTEATFPKMGEVNANAELGKPVVTGTVNISTKSGQAPSVTIAGQMLFTGATKLREYVLPAMSLTPRHRGQDFVCTKAGNVRTPIMEFKKVSGASTTAASDTTDYGLEDVSASFPIEITLGQPKGELKTYDLHGGMATVNYTMKWYAAVAPAIALTQAAQNAGYTMSTPTSKDCPQGGYVEYTWSVSLPLVGTEYVAPAGA